LRLQKGEREQIARTMRELTTKRNEKQPVCYPSAGSFFKRPEGYFAGQLIQEAGLMGVRVGGVSVSTLHAGFVINDKGGTATEILTLMKKIQDEVFAKSGVRLEPEVQIIGEE
ncbi:MAG: UDP-N-acetylenolpyruvoylglucosamine reductase, partial [Eubacteriales bacterium]|nr:UDP-N-acetylenolpyruvoylglucosamine reductase [Eubacteriales bacterium]